MRANYIFTQVMIFIPQKTAPREIPRSVKNNFIAEVKDLQQQGIIEKVIEPTEWVSAPTNVNKPSAKNGKKVKPLKDTAKAAEPTDCRRPLYC